MARFAGIVHQDVHRIELPRIVLIGNRVLNSVGEICQELGYKKALLVTGKKTYHIAGQRSHEILDDFQINSNYIKVTDATIQTVKNVNRVTNELNADVVIGIGGGRNIDVAKLAAARSSSHFISIPTVASHDGIASNLASIKDTDRPYTVEAEPPIAVIMDSEIIAESPYRFTASGCGDIISKFVEVEDWKLSHREKGDYYGAYAGSLSLMSSTLVMDSAEKIKECNLDGIRTLLEALVSCGVAMSIAGSSRPCSGSSHLFSHALDSISTNQALHGEQCGVGSIMMAKLHGLDWETMRDKLKIIGAPVNARELGIDKKIIIEALVKAQNTRPERYTILSKVNLDEDNAEELAEETEVI
jgi:glycerol-1-phosphate dehydrogenase [NAD(P)+]